MVLTRSQGWELVICTEHLVQGLVDTWCLINGGHHHYHHHHACCYAFYVYQHYWHIYILIWSGKRKTSRWSRWLRPWQIHWKLQWVIRCWNWWYFPVIDSVRSFHLSQPVGLVMQSTFRLLEDKTTMQKLFTKINDARPAIKKFISQVTRSAESHQLL